MFDVIGGGLVHVWTRGRARYFDNVCTDMLTDASQADATREEVKKYAKLIRLQTREVEEAASDFTARFLT